MQKSSYFRSTIIRWRWFQISYRDLLEHLATLDRQVINFAGQKIEKITAPTPVQARAFELLGSPVPVRLT